MVDKLRSCFTGALSKYHEINHALPEKIIVYRDGVGDGQLDTVAGHEVEQFYAAFGGFQEDYRLIPRCEKPRAIIWASCETIIAIIIFSRLQTQALCGGRPEAHQHEVVHEDSQGAG